MHPTPSCPPPPKPPPPADNPLHGSKSKAIMCPDSVEDLGKLLADAGVDTKIFGTGASKSLAALFAELRAESSFLVMKDELTASSLCRVSEPMYVRLTYGSKALIERFRIKAGGHRFERSSAIRTKKRANEFDDVDTALRAIRDDLHVDVSLDCEGFVHCLEEDVILDEADDSQSYPGLASFYITRYVHLRIEPGSEAEPKFAKCGLPTCSVFETQQVKPEGLSRIFWEWMDVKYAQAAGIRGFNAPLDTSTK